MVSLVSCLPALVAVLRAASRQASKHDPDLMEQNNCDLPVTVEFHVREQPSTKIILLIISVSLSESASALTDFNAAGTAADFSPMERCESKRFLDIVSLYSHLFKVGATEQYLQRHGTSWSW